MTFNLRIPKIVDYEKFFLKNKLDWIVDLSKKKSDLLVIIANIKGAEIASNYNQITYVGFPFSISENFQMRNTNKTLNESFISLVEINKIVSGSQKKLVVYLSMCFGNPYGEVWNLDIIDKSISKLIEHGFSLISLSDTIGSATPSIIEKVSELTTHKNVQNVFSKMFGN